MSPQRASAGLPPDGDSSRSSGPGRKRVAYGIAAAGVALAIGGAAFVAPAGRSAPQALAPGFPGGPYFALGCSMSHRNNDDAIVFAGRPGLSHNHTYIGNRSTDAATTPSALLGGATTCDSEADASTYWVPTLYEGTRHVNPLTGIVYYVNRTWGDVAPLPAGLKIVAGNAKAKRRQSRNIVAVELRRRRRQAPLRGHPAVRPQPATPAPGQLPELLARQGARQPEPQAPYGVREGRAVSRDAPRRGADDRAHPPVPTRVAVRAGRFGALRSARRLHERLGSGGVRTDGHRAQSVSAERGYSSSASWVVPPKLLWPPP